MGLFNPEKTLIQSILYFCTSNCPIMVYGQISIDPEVMSGTPVFTGTRVPVQTLFDYIEANDGLSEFLDDFPSVTREAAIAVLEMAKQSLTSPKVLHENFAGRKPAA